MRNTEFRIVSRESWRAPVPRSRHTNRQKLRLRPIPPIDQAPSDVSSEIRGARRLAPSRDSLTGPGAEDG
jgi:hypothetical protein